MIDGLSTRALATAILIGLVIWAAMAYLVMPMWWERFARKHPELDGVPGSADMVKVEASSMIAVGIRRFGIPAERNSACAIGAMTKKATKRLTPP